MEYVFSFDKKELENDLEDYGDECITFYYELGYVLYEGTEAFLYTDAGEKIPESRFIIDEDYNLHLNYPNQVYSSESKFHMEAYGITF